MRAPIQATLNFYKPPSRLDEDPSVYLDVVKGPTWPVEPFEVTIEDMRSNFEKKEPVLDQVKRQGFAIYKQQSKTMGTLQAAEEWNKAYLEELVENMKQETGADEIFVWNSVQRSSDPQVNTLYEAGVNHLQKNPIAGLQFSATIRPTAAATHVDQDAENSRRICRSAGGEDIFERFSRVAQYNHWRPITGPVTKSPLTVLDGRTLDEDCKGLHNGLFGSRVTVHHSPSQRWYYISKQMPDEPIVLKIYDSEFAEGDAEFAGHTGCDIHGADGPETPRESIEVRLVLCWK